jgi:hypothetical protein
MIIDGISSVRLSDFNLLAKKAKNLAWIGEGRGGSGE